MISCVNAQTATPANNVISHRIHARQIHANRADNVDDKAMISNAFAQRIVKANCVIWIKVMCALVCHVKMAVLVVRTVHRTSVCVDRAIVAYNAMINPIHADRIHA